MKTTSMWNVLIGALVLTMFSACGGGSGGDLIVTQPTSAVLTLSTAVTGMIPANTVISGYVVTISLPAGVTVKATPDSLNPAILVPDSGVVTDNPAGSYIESVYSAATSTLPGTVEVHIVSETGYAAGAFCKVKCDIAAGHYPTASNFVQPTLDFASGNDLSDPLHPSSIDLTGQLSLTATAVIN